MGAPETAQSMESQSLQEYRRAELPTSDDRAFWDRRNQLAADFEAKRIQREAAEIIRQAEIPRHHLQGLSRANGDRWMESLDFLCGMLGQGFIYALAGAWGTGKTQLAVALICDAATHLIRSRYTTARAMLDALAQPARFDGDSRRTIWNRFALPSLLVIDELNGEALQPWDTKNLVEVIDARYRSGLRDTLLVTNHDADALLDVLGPAVADRIRERGAIIPCNWTPFRQSKHGEAQ